MSLASDRELLEEILENDSVPDARKTIAEDMLHTLDTRERELTPAQRNFAKSMLAGEQYDKPVLYENLVSSGRVPRGREVPLMVGPLPLRPPQRRSE